MSTVWQNTEILRVDRGLDKSKPPHQLEEGKFIKLRNVTIRNDELIVDTGYKTFGGVVRGNPRITYQFHRTDGTSELLLITNATFYRWVAASAQWQYVSSGIDTTVSGAQAAGETTIEVADTTGFSEGDHIGITLDDGSQHQTTISAVNAGVSLVIDDPIPTGRSAADNTAVIKAVALTGSDDIQVSVVTLPSHNWVVFTNGTDPPKRYNGTDCITVPNLPNGGDFKARVALVFENYLIFMNTIEGGQAHPQRVRRSDTGDPTNWSTGNAGFDDLLDTEDFILAAVPLGTVVIIYRERSINRMTFVGTSERTFFYDTAITGEGVISLDSIVDLGDIHILFGTTNFYEYDGGFSLSPVGDEVFDLIFSAGGELNSGFRNRSFAVYVEELDEAWFFYPSGASEYPDKFLRYSVSRKAWFERVVAHPMIGFGFYQRENSPTWNELSGTWLDQAFNWNSKLLEANAPTLQLCGQNPAQVYEYDFTSGDDAGTAIAYEVETPDFLDLDGKRVMDRLRAKLAGDNVEVLRSLDEGQSFQTLETVSPGSQYKTVDIYSQAVSPSFRFKFKGSGGGFGLRWYALRHRQHTRF